MIYKGKRLEVIDSKHFRIKGEKKIYEVDGSMISSFKNIVDKPKHKKKLINPVAEYEMEKKEEEE